MHNFFFSPAGHPPGPAPHAHRSQRVLHLQGGRPQPGAGEGPQVGRAKREDDSPGRQVI